MPTKSSESQPELFYDDRFWEQYAGHKLISDPVTAIVELVANCWDAGAKKVDIQWPTSVGDALEIADDGEGKIHNNRTVSRQGEGQDLRPFNRGEVLGETLLAGIRAGLKELLNARSA